MIEPSEQRGGVIPEFRSQESRGRSIYGFPPTLVPASWKRVNCENDIPNIGISQTTKHLRLFYIIAS